VIAVVVDASALGAIVFGEPRQDEIAERLRNSTLHAPALLRFELANIAVTKIRRRQLDRARALDALAAFSLLDVVIADVTPEACAELALAAGLTAYDAAYLVLARQLGAPLVTLDLKLEKAARALP
jgi:predicted nucleic acid-binding protein